jgi:hypothetical protein
MARNTKTGKVLEKMVLPALKEGGYMFKEQAMVGEKPNGRAHKIDVLIKDGDKNILLSLKWQQTNGTAEQKVPFEIINLLHTFEDQDIEKAYLVLGGSDSDSKRGIDGWTLRKWYLSGGLSKYIDYEDKIILMNLEEFVAIANQRKL